MFRSNKRLHQLINDLLAANYRSRKIYRPMIKTFATVALILLCATSTGAQEFPSASDDDGAVTPPLKARLVEVRRIWTADRFRMRTDLVRYRNQWFCSFQDSKHPNGEKRISIIHSTDGRSWKTAAQLSKVGLRCSRLTVKPNDKVMLFTATDSGGPNAEQRSIVWSSQDGFDWTHHEPVIEGDFPLSRMAWQQDRWFGVAGDKTRRGVWSLVTTADAKAFETHVSDFSTGLSYEPSIVFAQQDTAYCLLPIMRTIEEIRPHARLGSAVPPYREWSWKQLDDWLLSPTMISLPNGRLVVAGRRYDPSTSLAFPKLSVLTLWSLEPASGKLTELLSLPSENDLLTGGVPGLACYGNQLWICYNSSHELEHSAAQTVIYLATVKFNESPEEK